MQVETPGTESLEGGLGTEMFLSRLTGLQIFLVYHDLDVGGEQIFSADVS